MKASSKYKLKPIFSGIQRFTTVDDEGFLGITLFTGGCNFRCKYCHNREFVNVKQIKFLETEEIIDFLEKRKNIIETLIFCGGEPTLHENLIEWIKFGKKLGYRIKLDTNATNSNMIKQLLKENLIDFFAIDYKSPKNKYQNIIERKVDVDNILNNIKMIIDSKVKYEIRTTVHTDLISKNDIKNMIDELKNIGVNSYFLQAFKKPDKELVGNISIENDRSKDLIKNCEDLLKNNFQFWGLRNTT
ncbi:MAG: anaerobic ribonucleoside-triphosphate reductase activating protein [Nanoarchaeota archaeon]|nr:anaerobic ribonucleoside-triphosphate reductase activating protein [Nanoarchaeota archaeon]